VKHRRIASWFGFVFAVALASLLIVGCGDNSAKPSDSGTPVEETPSLDAPLGGYTAQNEPPSFGDADLSSSSNIEAAYDDPVETDPHVVGWERSDSVRAYAVTLLWGILESDPAIRTGEDGGGVDNLDWTGFASINRNGAIVVSATIAFEQDDYIVGPRIEREKVMWVSHTSDGFDGLRLMVLQNVPEGEDGSADSLLIQAGTRQWTFAVNDLADLDRTDVIDDIGNKFSIRSFRMMPQLCNRGFLGGAWLAPSEPGEPGRFQGRWVATDGTVAGHVRGIWGVDEQGENVFYGKYVDRTGAFVGILRGTWEDRGPESPSQASRMRTHGSLRGEWLDGDGNVRGTVKGHWRAAKSGEDGFFEGAWREASCLGS
jgi:hypothetical protein